MVLRSTTHLFYQEQSRLVLSARSSLDSFDLSRSCPSSSPNYESVGQACTHVCLFGSQDFQVLLSASHFQVFNVLQLVTQCHTPITATLVCD